MQGIPARTSRDSARQKHVLRNRQRAIGKILFHQNGEVSNTATAPALKGFSNPMETTSNFSATNNFDDPVVK
jgi:hypothetical protein